MIKRLNNKGYMLVEIVLASVLSMVLLYFMTDVTIKLKNKNDDMLVKTLVSADQAIIYNAIMKDVYNGTFSCGNVSISGKKFTYNGFDNIISDYVDTVNLEKCNVAANKTEFILRLDVNELSDNFDVEICYGSSGSGCL